MPDDTKPAPTPQEIDAKIRVALAHLADCIPGSGPENGKDYAAAMVDLANVRCLVNGSDQP